MQPSAFAATIWPTAGPEWWDGKISSREIVG